MSFEKSDKIVAATHDLTPQEQVALAAANWVQMGIPVRFLHDGKPIKDPRTASEREDPVATYFALRDRPQIYGLAIVTGPESGIIAIDAYTSEPGVGMEALVRQGYFCECCHAGALIRHENFYNGVRVGPSFHTLLNYAGRDQFMETEVEELPGVFIRRSGEWIPLPPSEITTFADDGLVLKSTYEDDQSLAPAGVPYLSEGLRKIIRKAEWKKMTRTTSCPTAGKVISELYSAIPEGKRNTELTRRVGYLIGRRKLSLDDALKELSDINQRCCEPPLDEMEVRSIVRSIHKKHHRNG